MNDLVAAAHQAAATIEHPWDQRAVEWPLNQDSVVVDVGGYIGRWALQIAERYQPRLYVFEPQPWAAEVCRAALGERAIVEGYGLGIRNANEIMHRWETDGCSFVYYYTTGPQHTGEMREIGETFRKLEITHIDLMMMNIEGYEYSLIPHMLGHGILPDRLMVQFHNFTDPDDRQLTYIYERLAGLGYTIPWSYGRHLTAWERQLQAAPRKRGKKVRT